MSTSNTNMSRNWIILIFLHGILAVQSKKVIARSNLHSQDEKSILEKMDALIETQSGHYENNFEYLYFITVLMVIRQSEKPLTAKESEIEKFQKYNNRRLDLEKQMEIRVSRLNLKMASLPHGHKCKRFYLNQKLALEKSFTKKNSVKQKVVRNNIRSCPYKYNSNGQTDNNNKNNAKKNPQTNSIFEHHQNSREYNRHLKEEPGTSTKNIKPLSLILEDRMNIRMKSIQFQISSLPVKHKCITFYMRQMEALQGANKTNILSMQNALNENSKSCPFKLIPDNQVINYEDKIEDNVTDHILY